MIRRKLPATKHFKAWLATTFAEPLPASRVIGPPLGSKAGTSPRPFTVVPAAGGTRPGIRAGFQLLIGPSPAESGCGDAAARLRCDEVDYHRRTRHKCRA